MGHPDDTCLPATPARATYAWSPYFTPCSDPDPLDVHVLPAWDDCTSLPRLPYTVYALLDRTALVEVTNGEWLWWFSHCEHRIAHSQRGACEVSTILLGFGTVFAPEVALRLFETMLFWPGSALDKHTFRWATYAEAIEGHWDLVAEIEAIQRGWGSLLEVASEDMGDEDDEA